MSKYDFPRHLAKYGKNLKHKQKKLARKQKGSNSRNKYKKVVAKVYQRHFHVITEARTVLGTPSQYG